MHKVIIAAVSQNGIIGSSGKIPWHSKEEFKHFKSTTLGYPVIMGRKTFESMGKPLKERLNIIITRNTKLKFPFSELVYFDNLDKAFSHCETNDYKKAFIIGGGEIYKRALDNCDELIISVMKIDVTGDTYFPKIDPSLWQVTNQIEHEEFTVYYYSRMIQ